MASTTTAAQDKTIRNRDDLVVAAVNSCLDLDKLKALPLYLRNRFKTLLTKNRVKAVCFFETCGFGLRVYMDPSQNGDTDSDEFAPKKEGSFVLDEDGHWIRCKPEQWTTFLAETSPPPEGQKEWIIAKSDLSRYVVGYGQSDLKEAVPPFMRDEEIDLNSSTQWTGSQPDAIRFTREDARKFAAIMNWETDKDPKVVMIKAGAVASTSPPAGKKAAPATDSAAWDDDVEDDGVGEQKAPQPEAPASPAAEEEKKFAILKIRSVTAAAGPNAYVRSVINQQALQTIATSGQPRATMGNLGLQLTSAATAVAQGAAMKFTESEARASAAALNRCRSDLGMTGYRFVAVLVV